jgi:hypothetical protein
VLGHPGKAIDQESPVLEILITMMPSSTYTVTRKGSSSSHAPTSALDGASAASDGACEHEATLEGVLRARREHASLRAVHDGQRTSEQSVSERSCCCAPAEQQQQWCGWLTGVQSVLSVADGVVDGALGHAAAMDGVLRLQPAAFASPMAATTSNSSHGQPRP